MHNTLYRCILSSLFGTSNRSCSSIIDLGIEYKAWKGGRYVPANIDQRTEEG